MPGSTLITSVSRRVGIAHTVARRLHRDGWHASLTGSPAHDDEQPWGGDGSLPDLVGMPWQAADLSDPFTPDRLVGHHVERFGGRPWFAIRRWVGRAHRGPRLLFIRSSTSVEELRTA
jgi:NAD(P)-dependent dehydrogenase (short-subunit alcohol dehydrogenase family)